MFASHHLRLTQLFHPWMTTLAVGLALLVTQVSAATVSTIDTTSARAIADATINPGEYIHSETGVGSSFRNSFGNSSQLFMDSDDSTLSIGVRMSGALNSNSDIGVIYLDTTTGGFSSTIGLVGNGNNNENAIASNLTGGASADLTFGTGFAADFAVTIAGDGFVGLYALDNNGNFVPDFIDGYGLGNPSFNNIISGLSSNDELIHEVTIPFSSLGLSSGSTLKYIGTVLDGASLYRSNEFFGVDAGTIAGVNRDGFNNIAINDFTLGSGDFSSFTTFSAVPEPSSVILGGAFGSILLVLRRRRKH